MRRTLIMGNWKMNGSKGSIAELMAGVATYEPVNNVEMAVCAPAIYLDYVKSVAGDVSVGAQDVSIHDSGAYTGETAVSMLKEIGCQYTLVGHSERRQYHQESNELVAKKAHQAMNNGLTPVICIGETLEEREQERTEDVLAEQLQAVFDEIPADKLEGAVIAYEPVWAIGTGLAATAEQVQAVHAFIRDQLTKCRENLAKSALILYGGSLKPANAKEILSLDDVDGGLIGGASLKAEDFIGIAESV